MAKHDVLEGGVPRGAHGGVRRDRALDGISPERHVSRKSRARADGPKGSKALPIVLGCLVAVLACGSAGAAFLGMEAHEEEPIVQSFQTAPDDVGNEALSMTEAAVPQHADDVIMTLNGDEDTIVLAGEEYLEAGCHAVQVGVGDLTESVEVSGEVDASTPGDHVITYKATTSDGRYAEATRTVRVVESMDAAADLPVLMYHWVYTAMDVPDDLNGNYILDEDLEQQLQYFQANDYYYPSLAEVRAFVDGTHSLPAKSVVLTFDDGEQGFLDYGIPLLNEYEVPATSFVVCSDEDAPDKIEAYATPYVRFQSHSYDMHKAGSSVGKGGVLHAMSQQEILDDALAAEAVLGDVQAMAYPFGDNNETAWAALEDAGILCAFTVQNDRVSPGENPYALDRVRISGEYTMDGFKSLVS